MWEYILLYFENVFCIDWVANQAGRKEEDRGRGRADPSCGSLAGWTQRQVVCAPSEWKWSRCYSFLCTLSVIGALARPTEGFRFPTTFGSARARTDETLHGSAQQMQLCTRSWQQMLSWLVMGVLRWVHAVSSVQIACMRAVTCLHLSAPDLKYLDIDTAAYDSFNVYVDIQCLHAVACIRNPE